MFANQETTNETKLYIRSLKLDTTAESLKEAFKSFGDVVSSSVREITHNEKKLKFGFVEFGTKEEANEALSNGPSHPEILEVTYVSPAYIKLA